MGNQFNFRVTFGEMCATYGISILFYFLVAVNAVNYVNILDKDGGSSIHSYYCHEEIMRDLSQKLEQVSLNLRLQMTKLNQRFNEEILIAKHKSVSGDANEDQTLTKKTSCAEAMSPDDENGVYELFLPESNLKPFKAYCLKDPNNGPAWTVVQRRMDNSTKFTRGWHEYRLGFGDLNREFFIGLEKLHALTSYAEPQELWLQMEDFDGKTRFAKYETFEIGDRTSNYVLHVLGDYSGTGGDSMRTCQGEQFTTKDSDNDKWEDGNCADRYKGAWWFRSCHDSNLNGEYLPPNGEKAMGISWAGFHTHDSLKAVHMAIRPTQF